MATLILFIRLFISTQPAARPDPSEPTVTYLDLSGPAEPEAEFPTISKKGAL